MPTGEHFLLGPFEVCPDQNRIVGPDGEQRVEPKAMAVLLELAAANGHTVSREQIIQAVWPRGFVTDNVIYDCVAQLRRALGDETRNPRYIATVPKVGYRLLQPRTPVAPGSRESPDAPAETAAAFRGVRRRHVLVGVLALVLLGAGGWLGVEHLGHNVSAAGGTDRSVPSDSIAVLPFLDLSRAKDFGYFADGLSEEILNSLTQVRGLKVIARTSSFAFKGRKVDIPMVADKLKVRYVLEGSVRKSGKQLRITVQLVDAKTDTHLWSQTFDRNLDDAFGIQTEIARLVAGKLKLSESGLGKSVAATSPPDPKAYEHFLRGKFFWNRRAPGDLERAEREFRQAVDIDPGLARAWSALAGAYMARELQAQTPESDWLLRYRAMLDKALAADPNLAVAHARIAGYFYLTGDRKMAEAQWKRAQALDPNSPLILGYGADDAMWRGDYGTAVKLWRRAAQMDPLSALVHNNFAGALLAAGRLKEAEAEYRRTQELNPQGIPPELGFGSIADALTLIRILQKRYADALAMMVDQPENPARDVNLALAYWGLGRKPEYEQVVARIRRQDRVPAQIHLAEIDAFRGDYDEALGRLQSLSAELEPTATNRAPRYLYEIRDSPLFIPLRDDPRWRRLWDKWLSRK